MEPIKLTKEDIEEIKPMTEKDGAFQHAMQVFAELHYESSNKMWSVIHRRYPQTKGLHCKLNAEKWIVE